MAPLRNMARLSSVLVVDADSKGLEALAYGFKGEGCRAAISSDPATALGLAASADPQVVITTMRERPEATHALIRELRETETTRALPIIVLGQPAQRESVNALPAVDFLPLPVFVRDVLTASRLLLTAREGAPGLAHDGPSVSGALSDFGLFFLVRTMIGLRRSGILQLDRANLRGEIRFSDGQVTAAQVGSLQGVAALHHLLLWEEASVELKLRAVVHRGSLQLRSEDLLSEAERFLRDFAAATKDLGSTQTVFSVDQDKLAKAGEAVPMEVAPVLRLFDGQRNLSDIVEDSPFRVFETLRVATRLNDLGLLTRIEGASRAPAKGPAKEWLNPMNAPMVKPSEPTAAGEPAKPIPKDLRSGSANRRKGHRKDRNPEQAPVTREADTATSMPKPEPLAAPNRSQTAPPVSMPEPLRPVVGPPARASGTIQVQPRGERRKSRHDLPIAHSPSMVIDMELDAVPTAPVAAASSTTAATAPPPAASPPLIAAPAATSSGVIRSSGMMETPSLVATNGITIGRRTASAPATAARVAGSIQLDPSLMDDLDHAEMKSMGNTPPPLAAHDVVSFVTPPPMTNAPLPVAPRLTPRAVSIANTPGPQTRRPSGEFNALEADFFAREADLYKQDKAETFDDLEHGQGQARRPPGPPPRRR